MSEHKATIDWKLTTADFAKGRFSREHTWSFDGGWVMPASASPAIVPPPLANPRVVDPEEAFVASLSSCHMLTWLFFAARKGLDVIAYHDEAVGTVSKNEKGAMWVSCVTLNPKVTYGRTCPTPEEESELHRLAHEACFIANSVKTETRIVTASLQ
ncbi:OsmC family protein [Horticoccus sp. 23ND18S-11]|uniref:OsmC family protein n=1 Tax=Horticoccus sp. 23ND18S-11 TaxID=3391832 RepID=UPI0039C8C96B